ncbi:MAG: hypothetical protein IPL78_13625 [Chloroflexi bacterium]|nr:hypothetical protein [Chloroflexota bacterium]
MLVFILLSWLLGAVLSWQAWRLMEQKRQQQQALQRVPVPVTRPRYRMMDED